MIRKHFVTLSVFTMAFLVSCQKKQTESIIVQKGTVTEGVYASGVVKATGQYTVYPTVSGTLKSIDVQAGQTVKSGQLLFVLDQEKAALATQNALLAQQLSADNSRFVQDKISELEWKVQSAKDRLALDESIYQRSQRVHSQNILSEVDFEKTQQAYKSSKANYEMAIKQLAQYRAQLKNESQRNANAVALSQKSQHDYSIQSEVSGTVYDILVKEGTVVNPQVPLAIIGQKNQFYLELEVDENDMVKVALGQKLVVTLDSYKGKSFAAVVDRIYPMMDERSRTFRIEAHFTQLPSRLYPNLTAEATIIIQSKSNVISIPRNYLVDGSYVLVNTDEKRKVNVGIGDYQHVEITAGLNAGETIYLPK